MRYVFDSRFIIQLTYHRRLYFTKMRNILQFSEQTFAISQKRCYFANDLNTLPFHRQHQQSASYSHADASHSYHHRLRQHWRRRHTGRHPHHHWFGRQCHVGSHQHHLAELVGYSGVLRHPRTRHRTSDRRGVRRCQPPGGKDRNGAQRRFALCHRPMSAPPQTPLDIILPRGLLHP